MKRANILNLKISSQRIDKVYNIRNNPEHTLGKGSFGIVIKAEDKLTGQIRAIKIIKKAQLEQIDADLTLLSNEFNIMIQMDHPNIIRLYEVFEDQRYFYFVMEYMNGRSLYDYLVSGNYELTELSIREIFYQLMKGLQYLHKNGIAHRDIKPENIMFVNNKSNHIKIIDFGVSKYFFSPEDPKKEITLRTQAGSLYYISPEIIEGAYDCRCDIWSAGVILYSLFAGSPPFYDDDPHVVVKKVKNIEYAFKEDVWSNVSPQVIDLIKHMLTKRDIRYSADNVLEHEWMKMNLESKKYVIDVNRLKKFFLKKSLSRYILEMITASGSETDNSVLGELFVQIDEDGDGLISREDLIEGIKSHFSIVDQELIDLIKTTYQSEQRLNYNNFLTCVNSVKNYSNLEKRIEKAFHLIDRKQTGKITGADLRAAFKKMKLEEKKDEKFWDDLIKEIDTTGKGYLDLEDFTNMMKFYIN